MRSRFSSAFPGFDRRKLTVPEIAIRFAAAFACLATDPTIHLPAIGVGLASIAVDIYAGRPKSTTSETPQ